MLNRDEYRQMLLAGTVSFPATFPQVGRLSLYDLPHPSESSTSEFLTVEEAPSPRVTLSRRLMLSSVRAVFLPRDPRKVHFSDGHWLVDSEVAHGLKKRLSRVEEALYGIVFVPESAPSLLRVLAGMTAAESVQYYPPLPGDPSHNHYDSWPKPNGMIGHRSCSMHDCDDSRLHSCTDVESAKDCDMYAMMGPKSCAACEQLSPFAEEVWMRSCCEQPSNAFPTDDLQ